VGKLDIKFNEINFGGIEKWDRGIDIASNYCDN
jgi:hypothetical protein